METEKLHRLFLNSQGVSTDTRKISPKSLFFALKGENFNGNRFAASALEQGASFAVVDEPPGQEDPRFILVENVLETLQQLATFHRNHLGILILALTGSNGKTTTKELINAVLSQEFSTSATQGNLNNHIGVPLTLLAMNKDTEIGIVEMGANNPGEIAMLCRIAQPDLGYITNFGKAHLEGFKSLEGVVKAKSELYDFLKENKKTLFLNFDDPIQKEQASYPMHYGFGSTSEGTNVQFQFPQPAPFASLVWEDLKINSHLIGPYNATNMAAAVAIGSYFKVPKEKIKQGIENYTPTNNRSQIIERNSNKIILDAYNANPTSMLAALDNFTHLPESPKTVILGDMFELGPLSQEEHQQLADKLSASSIDNVYLLGENFHQTTTGEKIRKFRNFDDFKKEFDASDIKNHLVLIKGSRGMALERVLDLL